jgi:hypothetical protein
LNYEEFNEMVTRYNIVEFNTAVKPFYIDYFFRNYQDCLVYYIDPDIEIFDSLEELNTIVQEGFDFILTPHILQPQLAPQKFERLILRVGIYNLGFLGIKKSANSRVFIDWWKKRLEKDCKIDFCKGLFVDQKWVNYLPAFYDKVFIVRNPGYNMAYWNFGERSISVENDRYIVNGKFNLKFFHFSSFNPLMPNVLCKHLNYSFEKRTDLLSLYNSYTETLLQNKYDEFSRVPRLLEFKTNHPHADKNSSRMGLIFSGIKRKLKKMMKP